MSVSLLLFTSILVRFFSVMQLFYQVLLLKNIFCLSPNSIFCCSLSLFDSMYNFLCFLNRSLDNQFLFFSIASLYFFSEYQSVLTCQMGSVFTFGKMLVVVLKLVFVFQSRVIRTPFFIQLRALSQICDYYFALYQCLSFSEISLDDISLCLKNLTVGLYYWSSLALVNQELPLLLIFYRAYFDVGLLIKILQPLYFLEKVVHP